MGHSHLRGDISNFSHDHTEDTGWIDLQLINGWVNYDSGTTLGGSGRACQIRKLNGVVYFRGVARSGTAGTVGFVIPPGFRPAPTTIYEASFVVSAGAGSAQVNIDATTGNALLGDSTFTYLVGIVYPADA